LEDWKSSVTQTHKPGAKSEIDRSSAAFLQLIDIRRRPDDEAVPLPIGRGLEQIRDLMRL
jgi:hypothetical protein